MDLAGWIEAWGIPVVLVGAVVEGETVLALAGLAAHRGYLVLGSVLLAGAVGGFLGDQLYFELGRRFGPRLIARRPGLEARVKAALSRLEGRETAFIFGVRFLYGLRTVGPMAIGMTRVSWPRFALLNALGSGIWAAVFVGLGWGFGQGVEFVLGKVQRVEGWLFGGLAVAGIATALVLRLRRRRGGALSAGRA